MTVIVHQLTLRQYEQTIKMDYFATTTDAGVTKAEYDHCYPPGSRKREWLHEVEQAALRGYEIPPRVMDDVFRRDERAGWAILRYSSLHGTEYIPPPTRAKNRQAHQEMVAARRRGKMAAHGTYSAETE